MIKIFNKRNFLGALLFLIFVGEPTVGAATGLYTIPGFIVLFSMYFLLFLLYEALAEKYKLTYGKLALLTFGIYSVLVTGLLHGELGYYVSQPQNNLINTLIRIQCSFYPLFAYYLLNRYTTRDPKHIPRLRNILLACAAYVLILTPTKVFGLKTLGHTFQVLPAVSLIALVAGVVAILLALKPSKIIETKQYKSKVLDIIALAFLILGAIPALPSFLILVVAMPIAAMIFLYNPAFRSTKV